jgi:hypothetical protein
MSDDPVPQQEPIDEQPEDDYEPIDEGAVQAVATAMAKAHHGPDVQGNGGYMEAARTFVAGAMALRDYRPVPPAEQLDQQPQTQQ